MALGESNVQTVDTLYNVALVHRHMKDYTQSAQCFEDAATSFENIYGPDHADTRDARMQANRMRQLSSYSNI